MMASTTSATASAGAFAANAKPRGSAAAACPRVAAGGRRRSCVVRCDTGVEAQEAGIAALEQFKISADRYMKERSSIAVIGLSVHTAPVEMREKLAVAEELWPRAISELTSLNHIEEAAVLSTCNRMEIYVVALSWIHGIREVVDWMSKKSGIPASELSEHLFMLRDSDAIRHLFEVSAGLDSLVLGEGQILAQVKQVVRSEQNSGGLGKNIDRMFKDAITAGKRVRCETNISSGAVSVSSAAVELALMQSQEEDEDGGDCRWWDPSFFLRSQEEVSSISTTNTAMEEIIAFARSSSADGPGFAEFLAGYSRRSLGEEECVKLMRRMGGEGLALGCVHLFRWMQAQEQPMPVASQTWLVVVVVLGWSQMADEVLEIVGSLPPKRGICEAVVYNAAMSGVAYCGRYDDAWKIFELMEKNNVQPDHVTSSIILKVMKKNKTSAKDAWEFFQRMNRKGVKWSLDVSASLIGIFCEEGLKKEALIIQSEMEKRGIASNTGIYNTLMNAYCKSNQIEEAEGLFAEMKERGLKPTTVTYNILMDAYSRRLQPQVVQSLLLEMQDFGLRPNARSYNCLISAYGRQKKMSDKAEDAFLRMKTAGIKATSSSYTSLLCAYAVNGQHEKAHITFVDMKREGLKPSLETYTALLDSFRRAGDTEKLMETWKTMINEKVGGTRVTFHMVLDGLAKHGLYVQARDVICEFGKIGLPPTVMTYNILMNAYARGGQYYKLPQLLKEMAALQLKPDSITYSTIIYAYARVRDFSRAFYYHKQMVRNGQVPDAKSYRKLLDTLDVKGARKNIKDKNAVVGVIKGMSGLKHRKEKKDEFWKNRKKQSMMAQVNGHQRKRFL